MMWRKRRRRSPRRQRSRRRPCCGKRDLRMRRKTATTATRSESLFLCWEIEQLNSVCSHVNHWVSFSFHAQEVRPDAPKLSKKKLRRMNRLTVAELKQVNAHLAPGSHVGISVLSVTSVLFPFLSPGASWWRGRMWWRCTMWRPRSPSCWFTWRPPGTRCRCPATGALKESTCRAREA